MLRLNEREYTMSISTIEKLSKIKSRLYYNNSQLAKVLGVDRAQVTRWLDGKIPSDESKQKIDKLYSQFFNTT